MRVVVSCLVERDSVPGTDCGRDGQRELLSDVCTGGMEPSTRTRRGCSAVGSVQVHVRGRPQPHGGYLVLRARAAAAALALGGPTLVFHCM